MMANKQLKMLRGFRNSLFALQQYNFASLSKGGQAPIDLVQIKQVKLPQYAPQVKKELNQRFPEFDDKMKPSLNQQEFLPKIAPNAFIKHIDTSFESFFYQRDYNLKNFNFYLQVLCQQYKHTLAIDAFRKMETMDIKPNDESYNHLMTAYAKNHDIAMVEKLNEEAISKYGLQPSKFRYNALILAYAKGGQPLNAEKVLKEMVKHGLRPDVVSYTTVIDGYKRTREIQKCWELYDFFTTTQASDGKEADEFMLGYMIRLCGATHDSEKAIQLFNQQEQEGYIQYAVPYNNIIFALASTKRYSEKAIEYWHQMHIKNIMPDRHTIVGALKACSQLGDVKTAYDVLQESKLHGFPMTEHIYNELIRTYAGACKVDNVKEEHIDMYIKDAFELFKTMEKDNVEVNIQVLNSLVLLYASALRPEDLETDVLPLYDKYRIKHDVYTYQNLSKMYLNLREFDLVMNLYDRMKEKETFKPNQMLLNIVFETSMRLKNSDRIAQVLEDYIELKKEPPKFLLQKISNIKDLPDRIYVLLKENFDNHGLLHAKIRQFSSPTFREKNVGTFVPNKISKNRYRMKKKNTVSLKAKDRKSLSQV